MIKYGPAHFDRPYYFGTRPQTDAKPNAHTCF